mgnify:CR=1 FL=1
MGMKPKIAAPPPIDQDILAKEREEEAKFEAEKAKSLRAGRAGRAGTILTSGMGIEEEAPTAKSLLGGSSTNYG